MIIILVLIACVVLVTQSVELYATDDHKEPSKYKHLGTYYW